MFLTGVFQPQARAGGARWRSSSAIALCVFWLVHSAPQHAQAGWVSDDDGHAIDAEQGNTTFHTVGADGDTLGIGGAIMGDGDELPATVTGFPLYLVETEKLTDLTDTLPGVTSVKGGA